MIYELSKPDKIDWTGGIMFGTGHRPDKLGGYKTPNPTYLKVVENTFKAIDLCKPELIISGMALGFDTILVKCALERGIPFVAAVPFEGQETAWPKESQDIYKALLSRADEVVYVCDKGYAPWKMQKRNEWMVNYSDDAYGLACWNGSKGGTANCVEYALGKNKDMIRFAP